MLQLHAGIIGDAAGKLLVVGQRVFEEFLLEGIELFIEATIGDLGQQMHGLRAC